ncbi:MAG: hypothetical protein OEU92_15025 [Alphaproteobacteria bacterium]|nr:hypothetical protein [Alphaproteobacteria bacterium]
MSISIPSTQAAWRKRSRHHPQHPVFNVGLRTHLASKWGQLTLGKNTLPRPFKTHQGDQADFNRDSALSKLPAIIETPHSTKNIRTFSRGVHFHRNKTSIQLQVTLPILFNFKHHQYFFQYFLISFYRSRNLSPIG